MRKCLILLSLLFPWLAIAQELEPFYGVVPNGYDFWIYTPPAHSTSIDTLRLEGQQLSPKPLVLFLHGASLCGRDLSRVRRYGVIHAIQMGLDLDAYVLAPQDPGGAWKPEKINNCLSYAVSHYPIDTTRVYVIGMSLGGFGTIDFSAAYPHRVAAAMAICGGGNPKEYCGLNELPLWIIHGTADKQVSINSSRKVVNAMRNCDETLPRLLFTELQGINHTFPARLFYLESTYQWLFEHRLGGERMVNRDYSVSTADMHKAYHMLRKRTPIKVKTGKGNKPSSATTKDGTQKKSSAASGTIHRVRKGDTLSKIAQQYGTTVGRLCELNGISRTSILQIGQRIRVN